MHDTIYAHCNGRLTRVIDRTGTVHAELIWSTETDQLVRLSVANAVVHGTVITHPLFGVAHSVGDTAMTVVTWARPTEIPAIAEPGRLPLGAGGAILNAIALLAQRAGVPHLRYAGPYPTAALWRTLARSFRCAASEAEFSAGALDRALRVARDPIAIDFAPAPHERIAIAGGFVELRDGIERAVIDGVGYEHGGSPARLVPAHAPAEPALAEPAPAQPAHAELAPESAPAEPAPAQPAPAGARGDVHCEIWFGDAPYARVATLAHDGALLAGPHAIPPCTSPVIGRAFPPALRAAIAELVADAVPAPLATAVRALCAEQPLCWADLGARAARELPDGVALHAALWGIAPLGLDRLALALVEALAPVLAAAVVRRASSR